MQLPQMVSYYFAPWFPLPEKNLDLHINLQERTLENRRKREDLPDEQEVRFYIGKWWTLEELYKYGALPPKNPC